MKCIGVYLSDLHDNKRYIIVTVYNIDRWNMMKKMQQKMDEINLKIAQKTYRHSP